MGRRQLTAPLGELDELVGLPLGACADGMATAPVFTSVPASLDGNGGLPVRVLLTTGQAGDPEGLRPWPANAHVEQWWPQADVMPLAAAMVGHGGFGTTMSAIAAGVPEVVVPLFAGDQFINAARAWPTRSPRCRTSPTWWHGCRLASGR